MAEPSNARTRGSRLNVTVPLDVQSIIRSASIERAKEGEAIGERAMLDRLLRVGAIMGTRCQGCRSGKCPTHRIGGVGSGSSPMVPIPNGAIRLESKDAPCYPNAPTPLDKPIETAANVPSAPVQAEASKFVLATVEPVKKPERKSRAPSVKCTYPDGFALTDDMRVYAAKHGIGADRVEKVFEDFSLHHRSKGSRFVEWTLAWFKWCRNDSDFGPRLGASSSARRSSGQVEPDENFFADQERRWSQENAS